MYSKGNTIFWAIVACLLWSTAAAGIKLGLRYDTPFHFAGIRFIISGLMILPFTVKPAAYIKTVIENWKVVVLVIIFSILINYIFFYQGVNLIPGALAAVTVGSQPLVAAIVAAIMVKNDKLTRKKIITIVFGISGVILISTGRQVFKFGPAIELLGVFLILLGSISSALSNVIVSLRTKGINPLILSSSSLLVGGFLIYLLSIPLEEPTDPFPLEYWLILLWLSFMSAFGFSVWFKLLQRPGVKVSELNLWKFIIPVAGAVLSWLLVPGESPEWLTVSGMIIISISLIMLYRNS